MLLHPPSCLIFVWNCPLLCLCRFTCALLLLSLCLQTFALRRKIPLHLLHSTSPVDSQGLILKWGTLLYPRTLRWTYADCHGPGPLPLRVFSYFCQIRVEFHPLHFLNFNYMLQLTTSFFPSTFTCIRE